MATARMIVPHEQRLHLESEGWEFVNAARWSSGNVFWLSSITEDAVKENAAKIKGSIVLVDRSSLMGDGSPICSARFNSLHLIDEEGAKALLLGLGATNELILSLSG